MSQNAGPNKGTFSPYAVDSFEGVGPRAPSSIKGSYQNQAYSSIEDDQLTHQYEDPARLLASKTLAPNRSTRPRRKRNQLYESTELGGHEPSDSDNDLTGESWLSRLILFLILVVSLTALLLVVLIILGKLGPSCSCSSEQADAPRGEQLVSSNEPANKNDLPPDVQSLDDKIKQLRGNISLIEVVLKTLQTDVSATKSDIHETNRMINGTTTHLYALEVETQLSVAQTQSNISKQLDEALSATNDSFQSKLASLTAVFMTKLNDTAQNLVNADVSLQSSLNTINSSLSAQVQTISKLQGPTGPPGFNGSMGMKGAKGADGPQGGDGPQGDQGPTGADGEDGSNGGDGPAGPVGEKGAKGQKGDKGNPGVNGQQGPKGAQGPQGAGNFSQCSYKVTENTGSSGPGASVVADIVEAQDKKFLGVTCSTSNAAEYNLVSRMLQNGRLYECICKGKSNLFGDLSEQQTVCYLHYWECPLTT